jgi:hypothetical protein
MRGFVTTPCVRHVTSSTNTRAALPPAAFKSRYAQAPQMRLAEFDDVVSSPATDVRRRAARTRHSQLQQYGHRAVIDQFDLHVSAECSGLHVGAQSSQRLYERDYQRLGDCPLRGGIP